MSGDSILFLGAILAIIYFMIAGTYVGYKVLSGIIDENGVKQNKRQDSAPPPPTSQSACTHARGSARETSAATLAAPKRATSLQGTPSNPQSANAKEEHRLKISIDLDD